MRGISMLYRDQYGNTWVAASVRALRERIGGGRVSKMYDDGPDGEIRHIGYVVGPHWCRAYLPYAGAAE